MLSNNLLNLVSEIIRKYSLRLWQIIVVKHMEMLEHKENQILPFVLLGEQGGDPPNFIRFGLKRPVS